jgi:flagellar assembly protein FliH
MTSSSERFAHTSNEPTTMLPGSLDIVMPELTSPQERYDHGYKRGYMAGYADGARQAQAERAADLASQKATWAATQEQAHSLLSRLAAASDAYQARVAVEAAALTEELIGAVFELAEAVVCCELRTRPDRALEAARAALATLPAGPVTVRVNPQDETLLADAASTLAGPRAGQTVTVVADHGMKRGDCVVSSGTSCVDVRVSEALARARAAFSETGTKEQTR